MTNHHIELIEKYLEQKMSAPERADFEDELLRDPLLKNEFELQRDIVNSIKNYRKVELKSRLDNIAVNPAPYAAPFAKMAASIAVGSLAIWGSYNYFKAEEPAVEQVNISAAAQESALFTEFIPDRPEVTIQEMVEGIPEQEVSLPVQKPTLRSNVTARREIRIPEAKIPNMNEAFREAAPQFKDEGTLKNDISGSATVEEQFPEIMISEAPDRKNKFYYQNYDGKLYLYGDFSKTPYVLIELNTETDRRLFLNYNDDYFLIKTAQKDVTPLSAIRDASLIQQLNALKDK